MSALKRTSHHRRSQSLGERKEASRRADEQETETVASGSGDKSAEPEVRRAIPLDYVTTDDVNLRVTPDMAAAKMNGGLLGKGTRVKIAPQDGGMWKWNTQ
jgi:hypothetical protein